jgi:hypothetical protein
MPVATRDVERIILAASPINPRAYEWPASSASMMEVANRNSPIHLIDEESPKKPFAIAILDSQGKRPTLNVARRVPAKPLS